MKRKLLITGFEPFGGRVHHPRREVGLLRF